MQTLQPPIEVRYYHSNVLLLAVGKRTALIAHDHYLEVVEVGMLSLGTKQRAEIITRQLTPA